MGGLLAATLAGMHAQHDSGPFPGRTLAAFAGFALVSVAVRVAVATGSLGGGLVVLVVLGGLGYLVVRWRRARVAGQLAAMEAEHRFDIEAGLEFACLPGNWPVMARHTLPVTGGANASTLPTRLRAANGMLHIDKLQGWWWGRRDLRAEVALSEITSVAVGPSQFSPTGSSLTIELSHEAAVRVHLPLPRSRAEAVAARLREEIPSGAIPAPWLSQGIVVTTAPPPRRTPSARALGLLAVAAGALLVALAMSSAGPGPVAIWSSGLSLVLAVSLQFNRPPTMHRQVGAAMGVTAVAFAVDGALRAEVWRLVGTVICLGLAWRLSLIRRPGW